MTVESLSLQIENLTRAKIIQILDSRRLVWHNWKPWDHPGLKKLGLSWSSKIMGSFHLYTDLLKHRHTHSSNASALVSKHAELLSVNFGFRVSAKNCH